MKCKCKFDLSRVQWLNRELIPVESRYAWFKKESRFVQTFKKLQQSEEHFSLKRPVNNLYANRSSKSSSNIDIIKILRQEDTRTTLMIQNIPNKFTKDDFLRIFNKDFKGKFNLFLLPTDINEKKNYGYAFINFVHNYYIINFYALFHGNKWENTNSVKVCNIVYSKIQNVSEMINHFPIKVMYVTDLEHLQHELYEHNTVTRTKGNLPKVDIPLTYENVFQTVFPFVSTKDHNNEHNTTFCVDIRTLLKHSPNLDID